MLTHAYSHGVCSSRAIERPCGRDAGCRFIVGSAVPDHTVIARFRQRYAARMQEVFLAVLRLCHEAGLARLGLVALDGAKVDANRAAGGIDEQVAGMLAEAEATDAQEDGRSGAQRGGELPAALARRGDRLARLRQCQDKLRRQAAEAASRRQEKIDARAAAEQASGKRKRGRKLKTDGCELFIATQKDHAQRAALRDAPPRGRKPKTMKLRERMRRKLRTKRGRARHRQRGASVQPAFGQMKDRQGARRFSMRGLDRCRGEWLLDAAAHNLRKLYRDSVRRTERARERAVKRMQRAA